MSRANHLGTLSLLTATGGFVLLESLRHAGLASATPWAIFQAGCEAGMVGGLADWFAVSALFRPIPSRRFCLPHTNLLVAKRATLSAGIVDMVQKRWLSPETLAAHLGRLSASRFILEHLAAPKARRQVLDAVRDLLRRVAGGLDSPALAGFLERALREQIGGLDLGPALGRWLEARIHAGDTAALWDFLADTLAKGAEQGDFREPIQRMLEAASENHKQRGLFEHIKASVAEFCFDFGKVSQDLSTAFAKQLRALHHDAAHPLRAKLDGHLLGFALKLARGDAEATATLARLQQGLATQADLAPFLTRLLKGLQDTLQRQLATPDSTLDHLLGDLLDTLLHELRAEPDTQARLDAWVRGTILDLVERHHGVIGEMVAGSLAKLSDDDLVAQIEDKVGADLQYIRLNGAIVGGLVGMGLASLKLALGHP